MTLVLIEAVLVGLLSWVVSLIVSMFFGSVTITSVFLIGFLKHFISGIIGLHTWYCAYKFDKEYTIRYPKLVLESIIEGIIFILMYKMISTRVSYPFFVIGFSLHLIAEILGVHKIFCLSRIQMRFLSDKLIQC